MCPLLIQGHDNYCTELYASHAEASASYQPKIAEIQVALDQSVASMAAFEAKLIKCEEEYANTKRQIGLFSGKEFSYRNRAVVAPASYFKLLTAPYLSPLPSSNDRQEEQQINSFASVKYSPFQ